MRYAIPFTLYLVACGGGVNTGGNKLPESKPEELDKPEIELEVTSLDFGHVDYGQLIPGSVTVTNLGEEDLVVESISTEAPFYVSPSNMTLQGGASGRITVNVQLVAYGAFSADMATQMIRQGLESLSPWWAGLDLGVSWRTPWAGTLSVGAHNLISRGTPPDLGETPDANVSEDNVFSRTPYVRYEQDF